MSKMMRLLSFALIVAYCASPALARDCSLRCTDERGRTTGYLKWICPDTRACSGSCGTGGTGCVPIAEKPGQPPQRPAAAQPTQK